MNAQSAPIRLSRDGEALTVWAGEVPIAVVDDGERMPDSDAPRPFLHPLRTLTGRTVSDDCPPDHTWHHGLSLAIANVTLASEPLGANFWGGPTFVDGEYRTLDNRGRQVVREARSDERDATLRFVIEWRSVRGRPLLEETRKLRFAQSGGSPEPGWALEWRSALQNIAGEPIGFGSPTTAGRPAAGYGGLFLRAAPQLHDADVLLDGIPVPTGEAMGRRGTAMTLRGGGAAVTMTASADNPVTPTTWFVRTGESVMLCSAPFFDDVFELAAGESATWIWRLEVRDHHFEG